MPAGVLLQYLGTLLLIGCTYVEAHAFFDSSVESPGFLWLLGLVTFVTGTTIRIILGRRNARRNPADQEESEARLMRAAAMRARASRQNIAGIGPGIGLGIGTVQAPQSGSPLPTMAAAEAAVDRSRLIRPAMLEEVLAARPWAVAFAIMVGLCGGAWIIAGSAAMIAGALDGRRVAMVNGVGRGLGEVLAGSLCLMVFGYVRDHEHAIESARRGLTEARLALIIDSQRRIWRFFGSILAIVSVFLVLLFIAGIVIAGLRESV